MARKNKNAEAEAVAARTVEVETGDSTSGHVKTFTVLKRDWNDGEVREGFHEDNIRAARQYLINQGLRPTETGSFTGAEDFGKDNVLLSYTIGAEVARDQIVTATLPQENKETELQAEKQEDTAPQEEKSE